MERKGLGKGLGALISTVLEEEGSGSVQEVSVDRISPNRYQPRQAFDEDRLEELADSIREHGVLQPVLVKRTGWDTYELVAGERRLRAAQKAGLAAVPVVVKEYEPQQMLEIALIENLQREDINPVDAAQAYQRLKAEFGLTQEQIAQRVGKSQPAIANTLRLLHLPQPILDALGKGEITEGHARALLLASPQAQVTLLEDVRRRGLSVRETENLARQIPAERTPGGRGRPARRPQRDANFAAAEEALQQALGTKVTLHKTEQGGRIEIEFYSPEHMEAVVEKLLRAEG